MRKILILVVALLCTIALFAQNQNPQNVYTVNDNLIGVTLYHDNGVVAQEGFYNKAGKLQGAWISYDRQGNKTAVANYENGQKVGTWFFYTEDNTLLEVAYDYNRIAEVNAWKDKQSRLVIAE